MKNKDHTEATKRFLQAMYDVISRNKLIGGDVTSIKLFAESIGQLPQNFSKFTKHKQNVSAPIIIAACLRYNFNANWLITGKGEMYISSDFEAKAADLEERVKRIESFIKKR